LLKDIQVLTQNHIVSKKDIFMKKALCVFMIIGFLLIGSLSVAAETYTLGMLPLVGWSQYRVAEVKGLWEKQGITVKNVDYVWPLDSGKGGAQRRFDLTPIPLAYTATFRDAGASDTMYLGTLSIADHHKYLIIKKDLVNKSLKGQTIGNFLPEFDSTNDFLLSSYLKTVNTELADVRLVAMNPDELEANFIHNRLQAVLTLNRGNKFYEKADGVIAISTLDFYEPHGLTIIREGGRNAIPPEDLKKIMRGAVEAIEWIRNPANWEEYKAILKEYYLPPDSPELSDEQFRVMARDAKFVDPQTLLEHNQQILRDHFAEFRAFLVSEGSVKEETLNAFTYDNVVYNQALIEVLQEYVQ
jgi:NitT/TauT family transport system substrate-binding protein